MLTMVSPNESIALGFPCTMRLYISLAEIVAFCKLFKELKASLNTTPVKRTAAKALETKQTPKMTNG